MLRPKVVALVLVVFVAMGSDAQAVPAAPEKEEKPGALDVEKLRSMLAEFEGALYRDEQDKTAVAITARLRPHADELLGRVKTEAKPAPQIIRLLGFAPTSDAAQTLMKLLDSPDASVRSAAAFALGVARNREAVEKLGKLLDDKDVNVGNQATIALGRIGNTRSYEAVGKHLKSRDPLRRLSAIRALGLLGDKRAVVRLEEHLQTVKNPLETTAVLDALNQIAGDDLFRIVTQLERVAGVLEEHGTGRQTQLAQAAITEALNRFIKEQEKRQGQGRGGKGQGKRRRTSSGSRPGRTTGRASGRA